MAETLSAEPNHLKNKFTVLDSDIENQSDFYSIENHLFANEVKIVNEPLGLYSKGNGNSEPAADHMKNSFKLPRRTGILKAMVDAKGDRRFAPGSFLGNKLADSKFGCCAFFLCARSLFLL